MNNKKLAGLGIPLFILLPWTGFLISLFDIRSKKSMFVYLAFAALFGYSISFTDSSADSYRYAQAFSRFDNTLDYYTIIALYQSGQMRDLYRTLLFYFTSIFSNNPKVMYALAGLVYGWLSYLNLRILASVYKRWDKYIFILGLVFYTYVSLSNINGFRFWTGAMLFFYATYNFIILGKKKWAIGVLLTPLFHYGFVIIAPLLILYKFVHPFLYSKKGVSKALYSLFIFTFFASWILSTNAINLGFLSNTGLLSGAVGERISYVNSEDVGQMVERRSENSLFLSVQKYFNYAIKIYVFIAVGSIYRFIKRMNIDKTVYSNLLAFVLFFYSFSFIALSIPSGGRFFNIAHLFLLVLLAMTYQINKQKQIKTIILLAIPVFSFNIAFISGMLPILILTPAFWYGNLFWIIMEGIGFYV